jgi:hypothetical protein
MHNLIKRIFPFSVLILFTFYYINKLLIPNLIYFGEEKGFINYDYANFRYKEIWMSSNNFGKVIGADFFNIITSGSFWKIGQSIGLSPTNIQWWFYFIFIGSTIIFTYLALNLISKNRVLSLLLAFIYVTTIVYYSSLATSPKILHFLLLSSGLFLWLKYSQSGKARFLIFNSLLLISALSIGINPPQLIGAYSFIFLYILIFSSKRKRRVSRLLFLAPYFINMLFVFLVNMLYIKNVNHLVPHNLFQSGFSAPISLINDILRFFGAWWDYAGHQGLPYNDAAWYYHSPLGIVLTYLPFFIFLFLLFFNKTLEKTLKIKILILFIITLFLVKGGEPPLNFIFNSLYKISIFAIFREPWAKFMPNFIMVILLAIAYLSRRLSKKILSMVLVLITIFFLIQLYPIASDTIRRTRDVDWKILDVKVPQYWHDVKNWSKKNARDKRILILPAMSNNIYNTSPSYYDWKPFPFYGYAPEFFIYSDLVRNDYNEPENAYISKQVIERINPHLLSSLAIDYVIYQNDFITDPKNVKPFFATILPALDTENKLSFGKVDIYPLKKNLLQPKIRMVGNIIYSDKPCSTYTQKNFPHPAVTVPTTTTRVEANGLDYIPYTLQKVSNTQYRVDFLAPSNSDGGLIFMETYNKGWTIKGAKEHLIGNCAFNFWRLPKELINRGGVDIVYAPQTIFISLIGLFIFLHLLALSLSMITIKLHLATNWGNVAIATFNKAVKTVWFLLKKIRLLLLLYLGYFIYSKIFPFTLPGDFNALIFILLWVATAIYFHFPIVTNYYITIFLAIAMIYVRLLVSIQYAEIVAGWLTIFLFIDLLHLIILNISDYQPLSLRKIPKEILNGLRHLEKSIISMFSLIIAATRRYLNRTADNTYIRSISLFVILLLNVLARLTKKIFELVISYIDKTFRAYKKDRLAFIKRVLFVIILVIVIKKVNYQINHYFVRLSRNPKIYTIEPRIVYRSTRIIMRGYNLGWKPDDLALKLNSTYGEVEKDFWSDSKIIFTVPLHWKDGEVELWVEKPIEWDGKNIIAKSKIYTIRLIPTTQTFTPADEEFFQQLKTLDKETLQINGYK